MKRKLSFVTILLATSTFAFAQYSSGALFPVGSTGVSVKLETTPSMVRLTLAGPSSSYLALGAGSNGMASGADGFIYNSASATDYSFNGVGVTPSADATQDWTITSNTVSGSTRTVVATRSLSGSAGDTPIPNAAVNLDVFVARGNNTLVISNHGSFRDYATLPMSFDAQLATGEVDLAPKSVVYPNPSSGEFRFSDSKDIKTVHVFDGTGKKITSLNFETNKIIDLKNKPSGTYYLEIKLKDGNTLYEKVIKE